MQHDFERKDGCTLEIHNRYVKPGVVVMEMSGSVYMGPDCRRIDQEGEEHLAKNQNKIVFDLTRVTHIDSAVIGLMVRTFSTLSKSGGGLRLAGAKGMVDNVIKMTQLHKVIAVHPTAESAVDDFPPQESN